MKESEKIIITDHAYLRAKERLSLSSTSLDRLAEKAFKEGIGVAQTKSKLHRYLDKLWLSYKTCNNMKIYGEVIYMFKGSVLITLYQLPNEMKKYIKLSSEKKQKNK